MIIRSLSVTNVRSHTEKTINLSADTTVLTGKNGAGKTSLLEAIHIALQGTSFKGTDSEVLRHNSPWYRIDLLLDDDTVRSVTFDPSRTSGRKKFVVHEKTSYRLSPRDKYPVVLFEPEDLRLLHGSPSRRRQFIDRFITQIDPMYTATLRKYERALKQRNALLKRENVRSEDLFVWNVALSEHGATIIDKRIYATEMINKELNKQYTNIAHTEDVTTVHYSHTSIDSSTQKLLRELEQASERDRLLAFTSIGPHRHDIIFHFNDKPALSVASRGEVRSLVISLKRIEIDIITQATGITPITLLDDVFSDLDSSRQGRLTEYKNQTIISSTNADINNKYDDNTTIIGLS